MAIPEDVINEIKYRNDIETVISQYVSLKRRGKNLVGLCPFHSEKTPSFTVYPENGSFYCFGCGVGGDVFSFIGHMDNLDYIESVKLLAERSGVALPDSGYDDSMQKLKNRIYEINRETARFFHSFLMSEKGKWALDYLTGRGLSIATIRHFGLGAAPDSWDALMNHLSEKGYSKSDMYAANVIGKNSKGNFYDRFRKRVMFPVINIRGNIVAFSGRAMPGDEGGAKYVNTADTPVYKKSENLFGINYAKNHCAERILLVEGNMDVISLHQAGFENVVAPMGTAFTAEQINLLARYTKEIVLTLDSDQAGQKAAKRASQLLADTGLNVRVISIPDGKDPDEYIRKNGADRFRALVEGAISDIDYKLLCVAQGIDLNNDDGRIKYLNEAANVLAAENDGVTRDIYIGRLSEKYGVSRTALTSKINDLRKKNTRAQQKKEIADVIRPKYSKDDLNPDKRLSPKGTAAEELLISVLLQHPDFYEKTAERLPADKMVTSLNKRIYAIFSETLEAGMLPDISVFAQRLLPAETGYLVSLQNKERIGDNPEKVLDDCINVILEENSRLNGKSAENETVENWAETLKNIIDKKQKGN